MTKEDDEARLRELRRQNEATIQRLREKLLALRVKHGIPTKEKKDASLRP